MRFRIEVTAEDITRGERKSPCGCPIALAICRATGLAPHHGEIDVDQDGLHVRGRRDLRRASKRLPEVARDFMDAFDFKRPVEPIAFNLTIQNWCLPRSKSC